MDHRKTSLLLKIILIIAVAIVLLAYCAAVPMTARIIVNNYPEFEGWVTPWVIFISLTAVPVLIAAGFSWPVVASIGKDRCFTHENARHIRRISHLALIDAAYFFLGNIVLLMLNMNHPGIVLYSLLPVFLGVAIGIAFAALSHLTEKAALMQDDTDLTI